MLHYSKASSIEESRRYLVIKGEACLVALARERVVNSVVVRGTSSGVGLVVYRREEGGETINI